MTYVTATGDVSFNRAKYKPHDKTLLRIARNRHNAAATAVANAYVVNMITVPADSILIGAWGEIVEDSTQADVEIDLGLAGGDEFSVQFESCATAGTVVNPECAENVTYLGNATKITLMPNNAGEWNVGIVMVTACWIELDSLGATN